MSVRAAMLYLMGIVVTQVHVTFTCLLIRSRANSFILIYLTVWFSCHNHITAPSPMDRAPCGRGYFQRLHLYCRMRRWGRADLSYERQPTKSSTVLDCSAGSSTTKPRGITYAIRPTLPREVWTQDGLLPGPFLGWRQPLDSSA